MGISSGISQDEKCFQSVWFQLGSNFMLGFFLIVFLAKKKINSIGSGPGVINPDEKIESKL